MVSEDLQFAVDLVKDTNSTVNTLWTLYSGALFAFVTYVVTSAESLPTGAKAAFTVVFAVFAIANGYALLRAQKVGYAAISSIKAALSTEDSGITQSTRTILREIKLTRPSIVVGLQIGLSVLAILPSIATAFWDFHVPLHV